jgi:phosphate transport system substrate-binding protein
MTLFCPCGKPVRSAYEPPILYASVSLLVGASALPQERNGLDVQKARTAHVSGRAKRIYYTHPWDLSGLPDYNPQQIVSGTIREWGLELLRGLELE